MRHPEVGDGNAELSHLEKIQFTEDYMWQSQSQKTSMDIWERRAGPLGYIASRMLNIQMQGAIAHRTACVFF